MATAESPASVNGEYDPTTDKARKAGSKDPGWKYGYWADLKNKNDVTCTLCGTVQRGGIKRLKQHLAGGYGDAKLCESNKLTSEIRKEMRDYLEANKRKRPIFQDDEEEATNEVEVIDVEAKASVIQHPSSGTAAKQRRSAFQFSKATTKAAPKANKSVVEMLRPTPEEVVDERNSKSYQSTIEASTKTKEQKDYVDMQWALWFYECGISFNTAAARQFQIAIEATAQFGPGYIPPTPYKLGEPLLKEAVKLTTTTREDHEKAWKHYGCTLMSDGWSDRRGRHLINFLVNSPEGTYFLESVDASSEVHNATMLADLLEEKIQEIGPDKVVQVITDNGANYKAAGGLLMERIPTLYWTPCAAHCLDLMLEDIGKLKAFKTPIARARRVTTFIYRHGRILSAMREKTKADLVRPAATRFATSFLTLKSLHKNKEPLKALFYSEAWISNKLAKTRAGIHVHDIVLSTEFWSSVEDCLRASGPLLIVLRVVDGDEKPAMPEVEALMNHAKEKLKLSFDVQSKRPLLREIMRIIDRRWENQMDHPLYGAALFLNPGKFHPLVKANDDATVWHLRGCFLDVQNLELKNPIDWWCAYGGRAIELQRFARRIVSLCASSSGCERNWSTFEFIHTKKRNRLLHKRLNDIVFVSYNRKMKTRFQIRREIKGKSFDPLVLENFDWDNEWADSLHVPAEGGRGCDCDLDLTWQVLDEAVGASQALQGRNFPRRARHSTSARVVEEEEEEEEEDDDPHDDADVSDCEDTSANSNDEGQDDKANTIDEFDDGY